MRLRIILSFLASCICLPALAGNIPFQFAPPPRAQAIFTAQAVVQNSTGGVNTTVGSGLSLGAANPGRTIILALYIDDSDPSTVNSVTVGGVSLTLRYSATNGNIIVRFYTAPVPAGTTGDVVVNITNSGTIAIVGTALWSVTGLANPTPTSTANSSASPATATLNIPNNGFAIGLSASGVASGTPTCTWGGLTENFDVPAYTTEVSYSGASLQGPATSLSISSTWTATGTSRLGAYASWR